MTILTDLAVLCNVMKEQFSSQAENQISQKRFSSC